MDTWTNPISRHAQVGATMLRSNDYVQIINVQQHSTYTEKNYKFHSH